MFPKYSHNKIFFAFDVSNVFNFCRHLTAHGRRRRLPTINLIAFPFRTQIDSNTIHTEHARARR